ncbi:MAG: glycosyltransferase [Cyanobacteria bacterium J06632_3]
MRPFITIIINNYNYEQFLVQSIESALNQSYEDTEVIVVDDASSDSSKDIITRYAGRVTSVFKENGGQASALNAGFKAGKGEVFMLLDADDYLFPEAAQQVAEVWAPDTSLIQSRLELVDVQGQRIDFYPAPELSFDQGNVVHLLLQKGRYRTTVTTGMSLSRQVIEKISPIPEPEFRISADGYLATVAPLYGQVVSIDRPIAARRKHSHNLWASSHSSNSGQNFRRAINHDFVRYRFLSLHAKQQGLALGVNPELKDYSHLIQRLSSLRINTQQHPIPSDSTTMLVYKGIASVFRYSKLPIKRKFVLGLWFICAGLLPQKLAKLAIDWLLFPQSRGSTVDIVVKKIRFATR